MLRYSVTFGLWLCTAVLSNPLFGHGTSQHLEFDHTTPQGLVEIPWQRQHIAKVVTAGYPDSHGLASFTDRQAPELQEIEGQQCIKSNFLSLDIDDKFAFDIDEEIQIKLLIDRKDSKYLFYAYDRAGKATAFETLSATEHSGNKPRLHWIDISLEQARFANRGMQGTDLSLTTRATLYPEGHFGPVESATFTLCDIQLLREHKPTSLPPTHKITLDFIDPETQQPTPVRVGLYDASGKSVLPNNQVLPLSFYSDKPHLHFLRSLIPPSQPWPHKNRYFFYSDGSYSASLPAGDYQLVISKGPLYRFGLYTLSVGEKKPSHHRIALSPWRSPTQQGWYSGDVHIHMSRQPSDNQVISQLLQAEDIHVSNLLEMTNLGGQHFQQYAYGDEGEYRDGHYTITPGSEGPRTAQRGHTLALNIEQPYRDDDQYFLYHRFLKDYQQQGALTGYAHLGSKEFNASWGLALDAPFGLVDFVEIMQNGALRTAFWYERLNLGERIAPAAGSDFPYFDQPGAVRNYVKIEETFTPNKWFKGLQQGQTFITNGPLLSFSANGHPIGSTLTPKQYQTGLLIKASSEQNPDLDSLETLELVYCGQVIKRMQARGDNTYHLNLSSDIASLSSGWLAIRIRGKHSAMAHSAPIYLADKFNRSWCPKQVDSTVKTMQQRLRAMAQLKIKPERELEYWQNGDIHGDFDRQKPALTSRIALAERYYHSLLTLFNQLYKKH
ncbi:hypothetical protein R50073_46140 [Maricurvus nonylphenolicus]|uniref:CehA/McbA family metallohydrolase n=1 Tax=Maricurvus nonylphenolicus TaxID=1008307 RepID=UPI0036F43F03